MDGMWRSLRLGRRGLGLYRDARSKCSECFSATPAMADIPPPRSEKTLTKPSAITLTPTKIPSPINLTRVYTNFDPADSHFPRPPAAAAVAPSPLPPFVLSVRCNSLQNHSSYPFLFLHPSILITQNGTFPFPNMQGKKRKEDKILMVVWDE